MMDIMQILYSLWVSDRLPLPVTELNRLLPDKELQTQLHAYIEEAEKRAFSVGFKAALELVRQLEAIEDIS